MHEIDILVSLASLAGERMFFDGDSSGGRQRRPSHGDVLRDHHGGADGVVRTATAALPSVTG
ncbi:MAG: hypothetical protein ABI894_07470 [Ilumatobacteraceae bacterium]